MCDAMRRRRNSCLEPAGAGGEYGPAVSPDVIDDAVTSFPIRQVAGTSPTHQHHCYKPPPTCDECNKLELVALQDAGSQFYGAVWHRSGNERPNRTNTLISARSSSLIFVILNCH